jgi:hypothetical protein
MSYNFECTLSTIRHFYHLICFTIFGISWQYGVWTQDLVFSRQALYHLTHTHTIIIMFNHLKNSMREILLLYVFSRWHHWDTETVNTLLSVANLCLIMQVIKWRSNLSPCLPVFYCSCSLWRYKSVIYVSIICFPHLSIY